MILENIVSNFIYLILVMILYRIFGYEVTMLVCIGAILSQGCINEYRLAKLNDRVEQLNKEKKSNIKRYHV